MDKRGFSLLELLLVIAALGIIMAMYLSVFAKVRANAKDVVTDEAMHQEQVDHAARVRLQGPGRLTARAAYRSMREWRDRREFSTALLYRVRNDQEFEAYWYTLIDKEAEGELVFESNNLVAKDKNGNEYLLRSFENYKGSDRAYAGVVLSWTFVSTYAGDMDSTGAEHLVWYGDGRGRYYRYPSTFPISQTVAELSRKFMKQQYQD